MGHVFAGEVDIFNRRSVKIATKSLVVWSEDKTLSVGKKDLSPTDP